MRAHVCAVGLFVVVSGCIPSGLPWAPEDPLRPLIRPGMARCVWESTATDGVVTTRTLDRAGRTLTTIRERADRVVTEQRAWAGNCLISFDSESVFADGRVHWREDRYECDEGDFPVLREWAEGDIDEARGTRTTIREGSGRLRHDYLGGQLQQTSNLDEDDRVIGIAAYRWSGDHPVELAYTNIGSPDEDFRYRWDWEGQRMLSTTFTYTGPPSDNAPVDWSVEHHWNGDRYDGYTAGTRQVTYRYEGGQYPVSATEAGNDLVTNYEVDCGSSR